MGQTLLQQQAACGQVTVPGSPLPALMCPEDEEDWVGRCPGHRLVTTPLHHPGTVSISAGFVPVWIWRRRNLCRKSKVRTVADSTLFA